MAKSSKKEIERDEKKVLYELMKNSNQSINDISNKLGFSRQKVWRIIKKLEDEKTVWGYTAVVNNEKIGMKLYILMGNRTTKPIPKEKVDFVIDKNFEKLAKKNNCILYSTYYLHGEVDFISAFKAVNLSDAKRFQEEFNRLYQGFIGTTKLHEVLFTLRETCVFNPDINKLAEFF
jgi:DNA-binding Lrp family transcriptional regulator